MGRTPLFDFVRQSRYWKIASSIEALKLSLYLTIPFAASVFYANADFMHKLVVKLNYIRYPEADPAPPVGKEIELHRQSHNAIKAQLETRKKSN